MTFEVEIGDRRRIVAIEAIEAIDGAGPAGGTFRIRLDGAVRLVTARPTDLGLSLVFEDGRVVDAAATARPDGGWFVQLPHVDVDAVVDGRRRERGRAHAEATGVQRLTAPMPGRVVRVLVKAGDEVALRQGLVVVEAMKMENELVSPKAGRVREVAVAEGTSVEAGRLLVVVE